MNDKQLQQIEEWLGGQRRFKLLDTERKDICKLKGSHLQVWLAQYLSESDEGEAWLSLRVLMERTGLVENTVMDARKWLVANGWMRETGETAADKYEKPTPTAHMVRVASVVDEPTTPAPSKIEGGSSEIEENDLAGDPPQKLRGSSKTEDKVSGSVFDSASASASDFHSNCAYPTALPLRGGTVGNNELRSSETTTKAKPPASTIPVPEPKPASVPVAVIGEAPVPDPVENPSASQRERSVYKPVGTSRSATPTPHLHATPPPKWLVPCPDPACGLVPVWNLDEHIERNHPEILGITPDEADDDEDDYVDKEDYDYDDDEELS